MGDSLAEVLLAATGPRGDGTALEVPGARPWTYDELWHRVGSLAATLGQLGVNPGDRVVVQVDKSPDAVALYLACIGRGAVFTPVNPACPPAELQTTVDDADPTLVVLRPDNRRRERRYETLGTDGAGTLAGMADTLTSDFDPIARQPDDPAALLYTSGTTGRPKGAMITHANLVANGRALIEAWQWQVDDVLLHILPLFHVHGLFVALHCALLRASPIILLPHFDEQSVLDALPRSTVMMGVPTHYRRLLDDQRFDADRCGHVRLFTSGSAPMTASLHRTLIDRTGHHIVERYGMTETGILTSNPFDGERVPGTVGYPLSGVELRVVGTDGAVCVPGQVGVVEVRGTNVFAGYWRRPDATREAFRPGGWFVTGDVGGVDHTGRLHLEGRAGDMIISGGENVYPKEIELVLDAVSGVAESAVVGLPDDDWGEVVAAVLVAERHPVADTELTSALDDHLARFKHPKRFVWVDTLPRNTMGKVQKHVLREGLGEGG